MKKRIANKILRRRSNNIIEKIPSNFVEVEVEYGDYPTTLFINTNQIIYIFGCHVYFALVHPYEVYSLRLTAKGAETLYKHLGIDYGVKR
jgi:hypothetical protein